MKIKTKVPCHREGSRYQSGDRGDLNKDGIASSFLLAMTRLLFRNRSSGYSLVELLVVISVFVIISSTLSGILYFTLRANNKARILNAVSKNGNYALSVISVAIEGSKKILLNTSGRKDCVSGPITENVSITVTDLQDQQTTIACTGTNISIQRPSASAVFLIDTSSTNSEVQVANCQFSCTQADLYSQPSVTVTLLLSQSGTSTLQEFQGSSDFKTTVYLRNYQYRNNP